MPYDSQSDFFSFLNLPASNCSPRQSLSVACSFRQKTSVAIVMNHTLPQSILNRTHGTIIVALLIAVSASQRCSAGDDAPDFFEKQIRPMLLDKCIECHGPTKQENGVRLDRRDDVLNGKAGDALLINVASPGESRLLKVLHYAEDDTQMPPSGKLDDDATAIRSGMDRRGSSLAGIG